MAQNKRKKKKHAKQLYMVKQENLLAWSKNFEFLNQINESKNSIPDAKSQSNFTYLN